MLSYTLDAMQCVQRLRGTISNDALPYAHDPETLFLQSHFAPALIDSKKILIDTTNIHLYSSRNITILLSKLIG